MIMDIDVPADGDSGGSEQQHRWRKPYLHRKYIYGLKQAAARNANVTGTAGEGSERKEGRVAGNLREGGFGHYSGRKLSRSGFSCYVESRLWKP